MTLPELLHKLTDRSTKNAVLVGLYYLLRFKQQESATSSAIRDCLIYAHYPRAAHINVSDVLAKSSPWVECLGSASRSQLWRLSPSGDKHLLALLGVENEDVEHDVAKLSALVEKIADVDTQEYLTEAVRCLRADALRACVVFTWVGAVQIIRMWMMAKGATAVTTAVRRHQQNAGTMTSVDDLVKVKESTLLLAAQDLSIFDKNEKDVLENYCLDLRNKCGHPGKYKPGEKKVQPIWKT